MADSPAPVTTLTFVALGLALLLCPSAAQNSGLAPSGGVSVESVVTDGFFNEIKSKAGDACPGESFYTRQAFLTAARAFPEFGKGRSDDDSKLEIAAFFAHVTHDTESLCDAGENDGRLSTQRVAPDPTLAFNVALGRWMSNAHAVMPQGFGATTRAMDGPLECDGKNTDAVNARAGYYEEYCRQFGVDPGNNLTC